ncbi:DNA-binding NarL/FixJ family response regulator [Catenulispora sp. GAS73]|uniref:LuxR C-terminal-related transcriptional regulator n=1 Tax=Catenulispora sp. GAS73 TaxID=3156269 RepID=UPI003518C6C7
MIGHGELVAALVARAAEGLPTLLAAPPGRGKSALLDSLAEPWISRDDHVMWLTAAPADRNVPFAALADLLSEAPDMPEPWLAAVRQALRRIPGTPDRVAIRLAARACIDNAAPPDKRILLLVDDMQWWDAESLDVVAYLARHGIPVVAATRPGGPVDLLGRDAVEMTVPPLTAEQTATLLQQRGIGFRVAARVHAAAGGNARLTIEIARGLDASSGALEVVTTPPAARRCVRGWIDELPTPDGVWRTLLIAALAADPSITTLRRTAGPDTLEALSCAEQAGLIAVDVHGAVSFPATAVRDTVLADASQETLRTAHLLLAETTTDPTARLWHRASAARDRPDLEMATDLAIAARAARRRGDPGRAAELWLLAAEMMPLREAEVPAAEADAHEAANGSLAPLPAPVSGTAQAGHRADDQETAAGSAAFDTSQAAHHQPHLADSPRTADQTARLAAPDADPAAPGAAPQPSQTAERQPRLADSPPHTTDPAAPGAEPQPSQAAQHQPHLASSPPLTTESAARRAEPQPSQAAGHQPRLADSPPHTTDSAAPGAEPQPPQAAEHQPRLAGSPPHTTDPATRDAEPQPSQAAQHQPRLAGSPPHTTDSATRRAEPRPWQPAEHQPRLAGSPPHTADPVAVSAGLAADRAPHPASPPPPTRRPTAIAALLLAAATDAAAAGRQHLARTAVARLDRTESDHAARARARLAVVDAAGQAVGGLDDILGRALADAEAAADPALLSEVHLRVAWHAHLALGDNRRAHDAARAAVRAAELSQNAESQAAALVMLARIEQLLGEASYPRVLRRALVHSPDPAPGSLINSARWLSVRFALFADQLDEARYHLRQLTSYAERSGSHGDRALLLRGAVEIEARAGHGAAAIRGARRLEELPGAERASPGPVLFTSALAQVAGGTLEEALRLAERGTAASAQEQDQIFMTRCLALSGEVRLLLRDTAGAADDLQRVRTLVDEQGIADPAAVRFHADLAEVLVATGQADEAAAIIAETRRAAERLQRRGVLATLDRADAVLKAAQGDHARAEALLHRADHTFRALGLPLERGRVLLTRSFLDKRRRRAASARHFHDQAEAVFRRAQAPLWEPAEVAAEAPAPDLYLTAAEQRIVALVTEGLPNREIAANLFLSVKTVESVLTGVYRKLGVRSRTQLAVLLRDD